MNKKFLFKCVVALSAITPAAIVSVVEEPVVVQAQTQEQTGELTRVDGLIPGQTRHSGYANGGSSVEITGGGEVVEVPVINGQFSHDLEAPNSFDKTTSYKYTLKDNTGNVLDSVNRSTDSYDKTQAGFTIDEVSPNSVSGTVGTYSSVYASSFDNQTVHAWNINKENNEIIEKASASLPSKTNRSNFTVNFQEPLTQNSKLNLFVEGQNNSSVDRYTDAFGNPHTIRTNITTIENLNIVGDPVYPEPVTPEVTPEPVTPEVTPEPAATAVTPEPAAPEVTPETVTSEVTVKPVVPEVTDQPATTEATTEPAATETTTEPATTEATSAPAATETAAEPVVDEAKAKEDAKAEAEATSKAGADQAPVVDEAKAKEEAKAKAEGKTATKDTRATDTKSDKSKAADPKAGAKKADDNKAAGLPKTGANTILAGLGVTTALAGVATLTFNRKRK